ncbi:MAG: PEP-utilizing enzyme, partial [Cyanobacteria bacterium J06649_11]
GITKEFINNLDKKVISENEIWKLYTKLQITFGKQGLLGRRIDMNRFVLLFESSSSHMTINWKEIAFIINDLFKRKGLHFPETREDQLRLALLGVCRSWNNSRAVSYRKRKGISNKAGSGVVVMPMVFGTRNSNSGSGVLYSRNPVTGINEFYGEFAPKKQGDGLMNGDTSPVDISYIEDSTPWFQLSTLAKKIENKFNAVQEIEFVIENDVLWILQARNANCTTEANLRILYDHLLHSNISKVEAKAKIDELVNSGFLRYNIKSGLKKQKNLFAKGLGTSKSAVVGKVYFDLTSLQKAQLQKSREKKILILRKTTPDDLMKIIDVDGIITIEGGKTSHAAVVSREFNIPCVVGCKDISRLNDGSYLGLRGLSLMEGEEISVDASNGEVYKGHLSIELDDSQSQVINEIKGMI